MKRQGTRAWILAAIVAIAGVMAAVGAYAYFTNAGSGAGTAAVGTSAGIVLSSDPVGTLYPGGADVAVTVDIENPGSGAQRVGTVSGVVVDNGTCEGDWFEVDPVAYNQTLDPGESDSVTTAVRMLDSGTNQDACKNLTMTINWSST